MTSLSSRLRMLESQALAAGRKPEVRLFFSDQLTPCRQHAGCHLEVATGTHHRNVIQLSFREAGR
jgi:hypothetical protein